MLIRGIEKYMIDNYSLVRGVVRGGRFLALPIDVCVEIAFGSLDMTTARMS